MRLWQKSMIFMARNRSVKTFMQSRAALSGLSARFIGGSGVPEAAAKAAGLWSNGYASSLFYLGEYVEDLKIIAQTMAELKSMVRRLADSQLDLHISVDPTQIGFQLDAGICRRHAFDLANEIKKNSGRTRPRAKHLLMLDMEDATTTQATLDLYERLTTASLPSAVTLQAYLHRTVSDLRHIIDQGGAVRLVKGAFAENRHIAFTRRSEIDRNYLKLARMMLSEKAQQTGFFPIFGTHDERLIDKILATARHRKWNRKDFEFEMLYGVRRQYQAKLLQAGVQLRLYLPFGTDWWPYSIRRVGESFKNASFLVRSVFGN